MNYLPPAQSFSYWHREASRLATQVKQLKNRVAELEDDQATLMQHYRETLRRLALAHKPKEQASKRRTPEVTTCVLCHVRLAGWELREPHRICEECKREMRGPS